jgi:hypothetical protein
LNIPQDQPMDRREIIQELDAEIERLTSARRLLSDRKVTATVTAPVTSEGKRGRRHMSAEGRARIAAAQRARWAKLKGIKKK